MFGFLESIINKEEKKFMPFSKRIKEVLDYKNLTVEQQNRIDNQINAIKKKTNEAEKIFYNGTDNIPDNMNNNYLTTNK